MSKQDVIDRIRTFNRSARQEFLDIFSVNELIDYLSQLEAVFKARHDGASRRESRFQLAAARTVESV